MASFAFEKSSVKPASSNFRGTSFRLLSTSSVSIRRKNAPMVSLHSVLFPMLNQELTDEAAATSKNDFGRFHNGRSKRKNNTVKQTLSQGLRPSRYVRMKCWPIINALPIRTSAAQPAVKPTALIRLPTNRLMPR